MTEIQAYQEILQRLGNIEVLLAEREKVNCETIRRLETQQDNVFKRLSAVEHNQAKWAGAAAIVGALLTYIVRGIGGK